MNIYIIRHAEPDYEHDSLTEKGWREAELLSHRLSKIRNAFYYTSPLGRARDTASLTLRAVGHEAEVLPWLREYDTGYSAGTFHRRPGRTSRCITTPSAGCRLRPTGIPALSRSTAP